MSTSPIVNPAEVTPQVLAAEWYANYTAQAKSYNDAQAALYKYGVAVAQANDLPFPAPPPVQAISYAAIVAAITATNPADAAKASQGIIIWLPGTPVATPAPLPAFALGPQVNANTWHLICNGPFPTTPQLEINGVTYNILQAGPFGADYFVQLAQ